MKSALFVDFDNIFSGLRQLDQATADRFARSPMDWVNWMARSLALPEHVAGDAKRRILVRRCYLNPQAYQRFRPYFNLAGFEIVDCPALTSGGKTSTDIHMVLDIIDLLQHETRYDEFILLSADADFTPVLRKLRRWDRRTTVLAIGSPSAAFRASADLVINQREFVRGALGMAGREELVPEVAVDKSAVDAVLVTAPAAGAHASAPLLPVRKADMLILGRLVRSEVEQSAEPVDSKDAAKDPGQAWFGESAILAVARRIHEVTGVPLLSPERYRTLFFELATDVTEQGFDFQETTKRVRDRCRERGQPISRADVAFVVRGIVFRGHRFDEHTNTPAELAQKFINNVRSLCLREQIILDTATESAIWRWIGDDTVPG